MYGPVNCSAFSSFESVLQSFLGIYSLHHIMCNYLRGKCAVFSKNNNFSGENNE